MKIDIKKDKIPDLEELKDFLNNGFENENYEVKYFGWGRGRSILVKKSAFVGARIFVNTKKNLIKIDGTFGSLLLATGFGGIIFIAFFYSAWKDMEKEVYDLLSSQYE